MIEEKDNGASLQSEAGLPDPQVQGVGQAFESPARPGAEAEAAPPLSDEKRAIARDLAMEIEMLREFYSAWEALQGIIRSAVTPRRHKEQAAQRLVDAANVLRVAYAPDPYDKGPKLKVVKG